MLVKSNQNRSRGIFKTNDRTRQIGLIVSILIIVILAEYVASIDPYEIPGLFQTQQLDGFRDTEIISPIKNASNTLTPFGNTNLNETIWVIDGRSLTSNELFTAVSLQGLVNRNKSKLYVIFSDLEIQWLRYIENVANLTINNCTLETAVRIFSNFVDGAVIYQNNELSINIATTYSGIYDLVMVRSDQNKYGLEIKKDVSKPKIDTYFEMYDDLAYLCNREIMANLASDDIKPRDYVIQNRMLCLNLKPGPFSWPNENVQFANIINDFSKGNIGTNRWVFGWYKTPTHTEEDYAIQVLSHYGVIFLPCTKTPNLSLLQAIDSKIEPIETSQSSIKLEDKIYITFGFADGDNIDIMYKHMGGYWGSSIQNSIPISWSVSPALVEIAPVILQYYSDTRSSTDSFLAGGSGLGAIFPDFFDPDLLEKYVQYSASLNYEYVWLLNSYTPFETRYSDRVIKTYAENYNGIVLDYGSSPVKNPFWRQYDTPVVRSLHYMGDDGDFEAKLSEITMFGNEPLFLYITLYPWSENGLDNIDDIIDAVCNNYEFINLTSFFNLINSTDTEYQYLEDTKRSIASINFDDEIYDSYMWNYGWTVILTIVTLLVWFLGSRFLDRKLKNTKQRVNLTSLIYCGTATTLYLSTILWVIYQNYWQWPAMLVIPIFALISPVIRINPTRYQNNLTAFAPLLIGISALLAINYPAAILLGALGYFFIVKNHLKNILKSLPFSISLAIIFSMFIWTVWILVPLIIILILTGFKLHMNRIEDPRSTEGPEKPLKKFKRHQDLELKLKKSQKNKLKYAFQNVLSTLIPALLMSLTLIPMFYLDIDIINLKMNYRGDILLLLSIIVPLISYPIGWYLSRFYKIIKYIFPPSWLLIWIAPNLFSTILILILIESEIFALLTIYFNREIPKPNESHRNSDLAKNFVALPIIMGLFIIIQPMAYSVYGTPLPTWVLYLLYYEPLLYFLLSLLLLAGIIILDHNVKKVE